MFLNATSTFVESSADVSINDNSLRSRKDVPAALICLVQILGTATAKDQFYK